MSNLSNRIFMGVPEAEEDDFLLGVRAGLNRAVRAAKDAGLVDHAAAVRLLRDADNPLEVKTDEPAT